MSERLTWETVFNIMGNYFSRSPEILRVCAEAVMHNVYTDRELIRQETRYELLKDHFKVGETVELETYGKWQAARIGAIILPDLPGYWPIFDIQRIRRPDKTRPMTSQEMSDALFDWLKLPKVDNTKRVEELKVILSKLGISTEVPK